jgi:predicted TIM-barrel fold metal-dependent hydrolase
MAKEFIVSGDSHIVEPVDLFKTRLPKKMRESALWEEEFVLDEPVVPGGHTVFRTVHTPGYEGWTVSRYRQFPGPAPSWEPDAIIRDLDRDGIDATVMYPNNSMFALYTDVHERSIAHARVYNDWLAKTYLDHDDRIRPVAAIPTTDIADAVDEIDRIVALGLRALILPEHPQPLPYSAPEYGPLWRAAEANGLPIFFHVASGGVDSKADTSITSDRIKGVLTAVNMGKEKELDNAALAARTMGRGNTGAASPMRIISELVASGACELYPKLIWNMIEFNAGWLANFMGMMDKSWSTGTGQDPHGWLGFWDSGVSARDQTGIGRIFAINERWPYPLKPSEYVKRNIRVQFADDLVAVQSRHITGVETIYWGSDYPHAEGTFLGSQRLIEDSFVGVSDADRSAILGGNLASIVGFETSKKFAPSDPEEEIVPAPVV